MRPMSLGEAPWRTGLALKIRGLRGASRSRDSHRHDRRLDRRYLRGRRERCHGGLPRSNSTILGAVRAIMALASRIARSSSPDFARIWLAISHHRRLIVSVVAILVWDVASCGVQGIGYSQW
jgi:hypothetical protein